MKKNHKDKFKTPEGYFESFNERLMDKIVKEESIIPSSDGFYVPKDYFDNISTTIPNYTETKVIGLNSHRKYYAVAATIAVLIALTLFFTQNQETEYGFEDLVSAELDAYFLSNDMDLSSDDLAQVINIEEITMLDIIESEDPLGSEMILEYLDENVDEIEELNLDYEEFE
ncbi:hypothetical protein [Croceitalea vernalis]|uniref:Uncharacterized protein n=1 Tax=Croceitalea vernalis TaxID=3075599 RepID=A0ABU3BIB4_9FLAO|nr:hypothetical protein [Croceitalea sp. P007]MDT0621898.1 hypothetical protein [Croceitalea sp. P007]